MEPLLENLRSDTLRKLAAERFGSINAAEEGVLRLSASAENSTPERLEKRPEISGEFLRWLATDKEAASSIDPLGLRVYNCIVTSTLDLVYSRLSLRLFFRFCHFKAPIHLRSAVLPGLFFFDCVTDDFITADNLVVQGSVFLQRHKAKARIRMTGASVEGDLDLSGASLEASESLYPNETPEAKGVALYADRISVSRNLFLRNNFSCHGEIRLLSARIGGDLDCSGASLTISGSTTEASVTDIGSTLKADGAHIAGNLFLRYQFSSEGQIRLAGVRIGADLHCAQSTIRSLLCEFMRLDGNLYWTAVKDAKNAHLNLLGATIGNLSDDTDSWPEPRHLVIKGSEYRNLTHHECSTQDLLDNQTHAQHRPLNAQERIEWLKRQNEVDCLDPHAWMWLAKLFKEKDDIDGYRRIICEYRSLKARSTSNPLLRRFNLSLAQIERNPWSILLLFFPLLLLGTCIYAASAHHLPPTNSDAARAWAGGYSYPAAYPRFNPLIYTLENELPLIKFGLDDKWAPDPNLATNGHATLYWSLVSFRWFLIAAGWIQGILLTVGINRRFRD